MFRSCAGLQIACVSLLAFTTTAIAANPSSIRGTVTDPSGAVVAHATVELLQNHRVARSTETNSEGEYAMTAPEGVYRLHVSAEAFDTIVEEVRLTNGSPVEQDVPMHLRTLAQQVTVTSTGIPTTQAHLGAAVTVLNRNDFAHMHDVQQALSLIPGLQAVQSGEPGGATSLFIRGANGDANKVSIDGIPANDIGGLVNFANIATTGIARIEVLRGPNSALYGSDALAGVVSLTTKRGTTPLPQATYRIDGGNFGTYSQEGTLGGVERKLDYFADFARFDTANSIPKDQFHNGTLATNFGWHFNPTTSLRATLRHDRIASGSPNAILLYGIPSDAKQQNEDAYIGVTLDSQTTARWHNRLRYGALRLRSNFTTFAPTGIPQYDNDGDLLGYLGAPVTIHGANGYTVSGQAFYQYVETYPNEYPSSTDRDFADAQTDYRFTPHLTGLAGFKYEDERGYSGGPYQSVERGNYSYTLQLQGDWKQRLFYTVGSGIEKDQLYGLAGTPRASVAYYLFRPRSSRFFSGTKLRASFGKGVKEPALSDQTSSLFALLSTLPNGPELIAEYHVPQIGAEYSRSYDGGVDQQFFDGNATLGLTLFHSEFTNGMEYIPQQGLTEIGVPAPVVAAAVYGATVNSQAFRTQGIELELEARIGKGLFVRGGYTYLDAVVQRSFSSDALGPSYNPNFPNVPIGVFTPLIGARPFRRAPHTGYFGLSYAHARFQGLLTGTLVGRRDDSDFLSQDANGGLSLLLPNRNLDAAYRRLDLSGSYRASDWVSFYTTFQNLLSQHYSAVFGYPSLPFTFRSGMQLSWGGRRWRK